MWAVLVHIRLRRDGNERALECRMRGRAGSAQSLTRALNAAGTARKAISPHPLARSSVWPGVTIVMEDKGGRFMSYRTTSGDAAASKVARRHS